MAKQLSLVVGKDPHSNLIGFNTEGDYDYGVCISDKINGEVVSQFTADTVTNAVAITCAGLTGTKYDIVTEAGVTLALTGSAGELTGSDATFKTAILGHLDGMFNMMMSVLAVFVSGGTVDANTIAVSLDESPDVTDVTNWSIDLNAGTPNVVTSVVVGTNTVVLTVADAIVNGDVITVSHTAATGDEVDTITAQAVVNNEA